MFIKRPLTNTPFSLLFYSTDLNKLWKGETVTVEIPENKWTLVIGYKNQGINKYTVGVNGVEMSELPEAPITAAS